MWWDQLILGSPQPPTKPSPQQSPWYSSFPQIILGIGSPAEPLRRAIASSVFPSDCSPDPFASVIPKVNPPAAVVALLSAKPLGQEPSRFPHRLRGFQCCQGQRGHLENQTHHRETLNFADARRADKLAEHHVEPARESYPKPIEWEISWPLTNTILHSLI